MKTVEAGVAEVIEDDDGHHEERVAHGENVEGGAPEVLGPHIEVKISLSLNKESILTTFKINFF